MVNIIDFFKAIKTVYFDITKDRRDANEKLECLKEHIKTYKHVVKHMQNVHTGINEIYSYLPRPVRITYVQKTADLIRYGLSASTLDDKTYKCQPYQYNGYGFISIYNNLIDRLKQHYEEMKKAYNQHKYDLCQQIYDEAISRIEYVQDEYIISYESYEKYMETYNKLVELEKQNEQS